MWETTEERFLKALSINAFPFNPFEPEVTFKKLGIRCPTRAMEWTEVGRKEGQEELLRQSSTFVTRMGEGAEERCRRRSLNQGFPDTSASTSDTQEKLPYRTCARFVNP